MVTRKLSLVSRYQVRVPELGGDMAKDANDRSSLLPHGGRGSYRVKEEGEN